MPTHDPTYVQTEIEADPVWKLAFLMSEWDNDSAPVGWGKYRTLAGFVLDRLKTTNRLNEREAMALLFGEKG